ncbi:MAG: hypothetical protein U5R31_12735 [Acidimicrobiia bacterium]|nr:hypothetical protein [Acidimicrobiia bacterium]
MSTEAQLSAGDDDLNDALVEFESLREKGQGQLALLAERRRGLERERDAFMDQGVVASLEGESAQVDEELREVDRAREALAPELAEVDSLLRVLGEVHERFTAEVPGEVVPRQGTFDFGAAEGHTDDPAADVAATTEARLDPTLLEAHAAAGRGQAAAEAELERATEARRAAEAEHRSWAAREEALALALDEARRRAGVDELTAVDGVLGTLLDLVEVESGWEHAYEAAVGDGLAAVVMADPSAARHAVDVLRRQDLPGSLLPGGHAGAARPVPAGEPLREHVRPSRPEVAPLLDRLLAGVAVVDTWEQAVDLVTAHADLTVVTKAGDRFAPDGWRIGLATGEATAAALDEARQRAAEAVEHINDADRAVAAATAVLEDAQREAVRAEEELRRAAEDLQARIQRTHAAVNARRADLQRRAAALEERREVLRARLGEMDRRLEAKTDERESAQRQRMAMERRQVAAAALERFVEERLAQIGDMLDELRERRRRQTEANREVTAQLRSLRTDRGETEKALTEVRERAQRLEIDEAEVRLRLETAVESLRTDHGVEPDEAVATPCPELEGDTTPKARITELERELRLMGPINPLALEEYEALQERHTFLQEQLDDVKSTRRDLQKVIKEIDREIMGVFTAAFADVSSNFESLFETLFPGGRGRLKLTDPENLLETGIELEARPSGKNVRKLSLLSGGERSLTALAYLFAVFRSRPSPFYVMDEVEAALDDVNLHRFLDLVHEFPTRRPARDRLAPEAHDGGSGLPLRRDDAAGWILQGRLRTRDRRDIGVASRFGREPSETSSGAERSRGAAVGRVGVRGRSPRRSAPQGAPPPRMPSAAIRQRLQKSVAEAPLRQRRSGKRANQAREGPRCTSITTRAAPTKAMVISRCSVSNPTDEPMSS